MPFEKIVEVMQSERNVWLNPLYQVSLQHFSSEAPAMAPQLEIEKTTAAIDIAIDAIESSDGLMFRFDYSTELFDESTISRLARASADAASRGGQQSAACDCPSCRSSGLTSATVCSIEWNATDAPAPADVSLHSLFERQADRSPDAVALADATEHADLRATGGAGQPGWRIT